MPPKKSSFPKPKSVLVTGANGYLGNAICHAFARAGWTTYGLVRRPSAAQGLAAAEIIPIVGSASDLSFLNIPFSQTATIDVIVSTTEQMPDYVPHYEDTIQMLRALAKTSGDAGVRPLVLFTSGCKDYGMTALAGEEGLRAQDEDTPLALGTGPNQPPDFVQTRAKCAMRVFEHSDVFDAIVLRPTTLFGLSGSYYGPLFEAASTAAKAGAALTLPGHPQSILHGTHVEDCAEAYVAIAEKAEVANGQCYNISGCRYEILEEVAEALIKEYGLKGGVRYECDAKSEEGMPVQFDVFELLCGFSQWVGSEKVRREVGWRDRRQLFSKGLKMYRLAYEGAVEQEHSGVERVRGLLKKD